jgi:2-polyprenyl-6-methoxyphenol hydroxylase-like FAD-dependent oxidoreductase
MKIIIVGSGISGLSLYLFLQKHLPKPTSTATYDIKIYESHHVPSAHSPNSDRPIIGGGLGVGPNGMKNFAAISQDLHDDILRRGYPVQRFQLKNARGWTMGAMGQANSEKLGEAMVMISRQDVWDAVRARVPDEDVMERMKVKEVRGREGEDGTCKVVFEDGTIEEADLVAGCDGVKSVVRTALVGEGFPPKYECVILSSCCLRCA